MKRAALHNLGCKVNAYETEAMQQQLEELGYEIVPFEEEADIYVINTCTVTNIADRKSRQMLHRAKKRNPNAIVIAAGCYVQASFENGTVDETIDIVIGNNKKKELGTILQEYLEEKTQKNKTEIIKINKTKEYEDMKIAGIKNHTRAYMKIQDGCNQFCSYCIIPYARGRVRSRMPESVLEEARAISEKGFKEIVLTGIHLSSYGADLKQESKINNLLEIIEALHQIAGIERIRLGSLEPGIITEEFLKRAKDLRKLCPHFHLSLQSGCDSVLERMNRHYTTGEYYEKCELLRKYYKDPAITTDIIVGFPGETEEEFETTKKFLRKAEFFEMHVFKYSRRAKTKAASMPNQIPEAVKRQRSNELLKLEEELSECYRDRRIGTEQEILLEEYMTIKGKEYQIGHTKEYIKVALKSAENYLGEIEKVWIKDYLERDVMLGERKKEQI